MCNRVSCWDLVVASGKGGLFGVVYCVALGWDCLL